MGQGDVDYIPNYLQAKSPDILRRLMLLNNANLGIMFNYYDIQFAQGKWWAWYNVPVSPQEVLGVEE